jgi:hypothetical protein
MQTVKRIEIIVDAPELAELTATLRAHSINSYTVFSSLTGSGDRGTRANDEPGGGSGNICLLTAVPPEKSTLLVEAIRPILKRRGGICLVSDAQSVMH